MLRFIRRTIVQPRRARLLQENILVEVRRGFDQNREWFPGRLELPTPFAQGLPERAVELLLARLLYRPGAAILDIGHANAMVSHRRLLAELPAPRNLTGVDIAEPVYDTRGLYTRSVHADITTNPFHDGEFDQIWCISSLEHFGMDNSGYTKKFVRDASLADKALTEMLRILTPNGKLLITVPYGRFENHGWHINYDAANWARLLKSCHERYCVQEWFFRHTFGSGWQVVPADELQFTGYFDQANSGAAGLAVALIDKTPRSEVRSR